MNVMLLTILTSLIQVSTEQLETGKMLMTKATTNGVTLLAYLADSVVPQRTDTMTLELRASHPDVLTIYHGGDGCFAIEFLDSDRNPVPVTERREKALASIPARDDPWFRVRSRRMIPVPADEPVLERFSLADRYKVLPGEQYFVRVSVEIKRIGSPFQRLALPEFSIGVSDVPQ